MITKLLEWWQKHFQHALVVEETIEEILPVVGDYYVLFDKEYPIEMLDDNDTVKVKVDMVCKGYIKYTFHGGYPTSNVMSLRAFNAIYTKVP